MARASQLRPAFWIAAAIALTVALRLPFMDSTLTRDEGGDTFIAHAFHHAGPFLYGGYFLDRPPLLLGLYGIAASAGGDVGVRLLGLLAAVAAVLLITLLAVRLGGRRAAPFAAAAAAVMVASQADGAVETPAELLAIVPSCGSVLLLVTGMQRPEGGRRLFAAAGAAAGAAILVKQSFGDALVAGVVGLAVAAATGGRAERREVAARAAAFAAGLAAVLAALAGWAVGVGATAHELWYALFGFRIDAAHVLATGRPAGRLLGLVHPALSSGVAIGVLAAVAGIALARAGPEIGAALGAWLLAGLAGIVLSGSYFPPYVIELVPVAAVGAALVCVRLPLLGVVLLLALAVPALLPTVRASVHDSADAYHREARTMGEYVRVRAEPGQTAYVLYARANALYYSRLPSPFPYHWALMLRAIPGAREQLRALLRGPSRPTWIIDQDRTNAFGLDPRGQTRALLRRHYRRVALVCGHAILLARGAPAKPPPRTPGPCARSGGAG